MFIYNSHRNPPPNQAIPRRLNMMLIRHVIRDREPYSMNASATVQEAAEFMASRNVGAVCVVDDAGKLLGVFSERDVLKRVVVQRRDPASVKVGDVTSELRAVINCDETPHQALERMEVIGTRHLPVVDGERWVGMLSMRDLMRVELGEQGDEIKLLHEYIQH
jgi:CBS domain-containing protein